MSEVVIAFGGARGLGRFGRISKLTGLLRKAIPDANIRWCAFEDPALWRGNVTAPFTATQYGSEMPLAQLVTSDTTAILIDNYPDGPAGRLGPAVKAIRAAHPRCAILLLLRDVVDDAGRVRERLCQSAGYELLEQCFDGVLVLGRRHLFDPMTEYQLPNHLDCFFLGYVPPLSIVGPRPPGLRLLVTAGGGDDAAWMPTVVGQLAGLGWAMDIVTGPKMPPSLVDAVTAASEGRHNVVRNADSLTPLLSTASIVVCAGGYNTLTEVIHARRGAVVFPRRSPTTEQLIRARLFEQLGLLRVANSLDPGELGQLCEAAGLRAERAFDDGEAEGVFATEGDAGAAWRWIARTRGRGG